MTTELLGQVVLYVGSPLCLLVAIIMWRNSLSAPRVRVLRHDAVSATVVFIVVITFGLIFVNNDTLPPPLSVVITKWVTRWAMTLLAFVPAVGLLWLLYRSARRER